MLRARILTAVILLAGFLAALFWLPRVGWIALVGSVLAVAAWEWAGLARLGPLSRSIYALAIAAAGTWAGWNAGAEPGPLLGHSWLYVAATVFWVVLAPVWLWERPAFATPAMPLLAGVIVLVPNAAAMVALRGESPVLLLAVMAVVWISDSAAFFTGRRFGRRKLAPAVSPGKTWEGVWGALLAVAAYGLSWHWFPDAALPRGSSTGVTSLGFLALGFAVLGILGDLFESQMKRNAGVKDSGRLLPGHGGALDRIDALLPVLPAAAWMFAR